MLNIKLKKFILVYCLATFTSLIIHHFQNHCASILNEYKIHNIICSIVRTPSFTKSQNNFIFDKLNNNLKLSLQTSLNKKQFGFNTYKFCLICNLNINFSNFNIKQIIIDDLIFLSLPHIFFFSNSFTIVKTNQFLRWFSYKAHSPPLV